MAKEIRKSKTVKAKRKWNLKLIQVFNIFLLVFFIVGLLFFLRPKTSEVEKRELAEIPPISLSSLMNGTFFSGLDTWYGDTYPFRENFVNMAFSLENLYGINTMEIHGNAVKSADSIPSASVTAAPLISSVPTPTPQSSDASSVPVDKEDGTIHATPEIAGTVYIADGSGFDIYYFNKGGADAYASMMNTVKSKLGSSIKMYSILAPTNFSVSLDEAAQETLNGSNIKDAFGYIDSMLDKSIIQVGVTDELINRNYEYIYFRSDHHWTALGAYIAYEKFCEKKGIAHHALSYFTKVSYDNILGTFYAYSNQSEALGSNPDTIDAYIPQGTNRQTGIGKDGNAFERPIINDMSKASSGSKYSCFLGGDNAISEITNPAIHDGSAALLIKESYGNAFAPFLVDHYEKLYVVDYRYYNDKILDLINKNNIQDVIFLNNSDALSEKNSGLMLNMFLR